MELESLDADAVADAIVAAGVAPLAAAGCAARTSSASFASWRGEQGGAASTFFDLASLTKPMTAVAIARSGIDPAAPLGALLPELAATASGAVPLELILAHRAGLAPSLALFAPLVEGGT